MTTGHSTDQRRVVVGLDGSPQSLRALRWAAFVAGTISGRLDAVSAWEYPSTYGWAASPPDWDPARDLDGVLREAVQEVFGDHPPVPIEISVREGGAARVLLEASQGDRCLWSGQPWSRRLRRASARLGKCERC